MSDSKPLICQKCYEKRDLPGTFESRFEVGVVLIGVCDICYEATVCVHVTPEDARSARRNERLLIGAIVFLALLAIPVYFFFCQLKRNMMKNKSVKISRLIP